MYLALKDLDHHRVGIDHTDHTDNLCEVWHVHTSTSAFILHAFRQRTVDEIYTYTLASTITAIARVAYRAVAPSSPSTSGHAHQGAVDFFERIFEVSVAELLQVCLLYTSPSPRDGLLSRMPSSA